MHVASNFLWLPEKVDASMDSTQVSSTELGQLLDIATMLRELTSDTSMLARIPALLTTTLNLGPVTFALTRQDNSQADPVIVSLATSQSISTDQAMIDLTRDVLAHFMRSESAVGVTEHAPASVDRVFIRRVNRQHTMMLIMHQSVASSDRIDLMNILTGYLSKTLFAALSWQVYPTPLGEPFTALTEREWVVLCGLRSDDGEKQLADRLHLSPHTLHSHIKSIYRKMSVQGRLPLLQRLDQAIQDYRIRIFSGLSTTPAAQSSDRLAG